MESGIKIVSVNVSTEPSCELAASSSQNSLSGGSFMEVNTDMKKVLRGDCTCCVPRCYSNTKRTMNSLFTSFLGIIFEREMDQFYQEKGFYTW